MREPKKDPVPGSAKSVAAFPGVARCGRSLSDLTFRSRSCHCPWLGTAQGRTHPSHSKGPFRLVWPKRHAVCKLHGVSLPSLGASNTTSRQDGEERSDPRAGQEQQGRQERGGDGQGQGPHEGGRRRPDRGQGQEKGRPLGPEERQGQGEEGRPQRPPELAPAAGTSKCCGGTGLCGAPRPSLRTQP